MPDEKRLAKLAERIIDLDFYNAMDNGATVDSVMDDIQTHTADVIEYLLDFIDDIIGG